MVFVKWKHKYYVEVQSHDRHFFIKLVLHLMCVSSGTNEGNEKRGRVQAGPVLGSRAADETEILSEWSGTDQNPPPVTEHAGTPEKQRLSQDKTSKSS